MKSVVQHGGTADASFTATVDLAQQGRVWTYHGQFGLRRVNGGWKVVVGAERDQPPASARASGWPW